MSMATAIAQPAPEADRISVSGPAPLTMSLVICTRDRPESLLRCVRSIAGQRRPPVELIVVDDGHLSPEQRESIASVFQNGRIRFIFLSKSRPGLPASRNLAVRHARGDIVQFLDDDVEVAPDFCETVLDVYERDPGGIVVGTEGVLHDDVPSSTARAFEAVYRLAGWWALRPKNACRRPLPASLRDRRQAVPACTTSGACMAFRRSALLHERFDEGLGGYALGEDRDMSLRLTRCGRLLRVVHAVGIHRHDPAGRPDHRAFGRMTVLNYVRIMGRIGRTDLGDAAVIGYTLSVITLTIALCSPMRPRRYFPELLGLLSGMTTLLKDLATGGPPAQIAPAPAGSKRQTASNSLAP